MTKLLVQGDDFGFTKGVTCGIVDAIDNGVLRNTGLFSNMPDAVFAVSFMKDRPQACFGEDFNIVSGKPCADPEKIPHLVDENGEFIRSGKRLQDPRYATEEGRREMFPAEEVWTEIRAQYDKFLELTGGIRPGYLHLHSLMHENYIEAVQRLSKETGIPFSMEMQEKYHFMSPYKLIKQNGPGSLNKKVFDPIAQLNKDPLGDLQKCADQLLKYEYIMIGGHPGFLDAQLLSLTTLSIERIRDHEMMTSEWIKNWVRENHIELITYRDLEG